MRKDKGRKKKTKTDTCWIIIQLAPITGILLSDYYLVHHQKYQVLELYDPQGRYRYNRLGTNWRAMVAFVASWIPLTPGFAHAVSISKQNKSHSLTFSSLTFCLDDE